MISLPDFEIEFKLFLFQQHAPVNEKKCSDYKQTDDGGHDALHGKRAANEAAGISDSVTSGQNHHGVTDELAKEKRSEERSRKGLTPGLPLFLFGVLLTMAHLDAACRR